MKYFSHIKITKLVKILYFENDKIYLNHFVFFKIVLIFIKLY